MPNRYNTSSEEEDVVIVSMVHNPARLGTDKVRLLLLKLVLIHGRREKTQLHSYTVTQLHNVGVYTCDILPFLAGRLGTFATSR